jgi:hypothetical protein
VLKKRPKDLNLKQKEEILKKHGIYPGFRSTYTYEAILSAMDEYRLAFEKEQQQSWMPTEEEWKQFPEAKWAALDLDGQRDMYRQEPERHDRFDVWDGDCIIDASKMMKPITDWFLAKCQRPEGI